MMSVEAGVGETVVAAVSNITLGSWPDWLAAICTAAAALVAAFSYRHSVRLRREAQARLVYSRLASYRTLAGNVSVVRPGAFIISASAQELIATRQGLHTLQRVSKVDVHVHNDSAELIGPYRIQTRLKNGHEIHAMAADVLRPNHIATWSIYFAPLDADDISAFDVVLQFRDASSRWWQRHSLGPIRPVSRREQRTLQEISTMDDHPHITDLARTG